MSKIRVTISIQESLIHKIDSLIDKQNIRNRSHAIESILADAIESPLINQAIVFIGGQEAQNALQFTKQLITSLSDVGVLNIIVIHGEMIGDLQNSFNQQIPPDMNISYHITKEGSGGGLREIQDQLNERFFVVNTNVNISPDLPRIINMHQKFDAILTLQPTDLVTLTGVGIANKEIVGYIPQGFSLLEDETTQALVDANELLIIPPVQMSLKSVK